MGGDPHFSLLLPTGQLLCFSVQGEQGFTFNLISNDQVQVNAFFVPDDQRDEVTWIGALGIVAKSSRYKHMNSTKLHFEASERKIFIGDKVTLEAAGIGGISLANGRLTVQDREERSENPEVSVSLEDVGMEFVVKYLKGNRLDMVWKKVSQQSRNSHGLIGMKIVLLLVGCYCT